MLLDHFRPPIFNLRHWTGFHSRWAGNIAVDLNQQLPDGWFAEPTVQWAVEVDVATFEEAKSLVGTTAGKSSPPSWEPSVPARTVDFALTTDVVEIRVYREVSEVPLVGVIELVSPANKDRTETREAFIAKCEAYLRSALGLVMVDIVTEYRANLHALLMERIGEPEKQNDPIYTSAYHPVRRDNGAQLEIWYEPLGVGKRLPSMPLFLKNGPHVPVNLADTYRQTLEDLRYPQNRESQTEP